MGMSADEFWLMPIGLFLDLWECHRQWLSLAKPQMTYELDDVIPYD